MAEHQALYATDEVRDPSFSMLKNRPIPCGEISMDDRLLSSVSKGGRFERMGLRLSKSVNFYFSFGDYLNSMNSQQHILAAKTVANIIRTSLGPRGSSIPV